MKKGLLIFLIIYTMCGAMASRIPRAVPNEENNKKEICADQTACGWSIFKSNSPDIIELNVTNTYCICGAGTSCQLYDSSASVNFYRCQELENS